MNTIQLTEKNKQLINALIAQRNNASSQLEQTIITILEAKEIDYENKSIDIDKEGNLVIKEKESDVLDVQE